MTDCIGGPINASITFSDCCTNYGVSYDLDGRCYPCPQTSKHSQNIFTEYVCVHMYICTVYKLTTDLRVLIPM